MRGGIQRWLRFVWTAVIEDFSILAPKLSFINRANETDMVNFYRIFGMNTTPDSLFVDFLCGTGVPSEALWDTYVTEGLLQNVPTRSIMDRPSFRPQMLTQAMTGSTQLPSDKMKGWVGRPHPCGRLVETGLPPFSESARSSHSPCPGAVET